LKTIFFPNIKLVFHEHGEIFEDGKIYSKLMSFFKEKIDIFIAVSNATKKELEKKIKINKEKIIFLYNFVDLNEFKKIENFDIETQRKKY
jgi:L-malate glycosyltransferase